MSTLAPGLSGCDSVRTLDGNGRTSERSLLGCWCCCLGVRQNDKAAWGLGAAEHSWAVKGDCWGDVKAAETYQQVWKAVLWNERVGHL